MTDLDKIVAEAVERGFRVLDDPHLEVPAEYDSAEEHALNECARRAALAALEMAAVHLDGMAEDTDNLASDHNDDGDQVLACTLAEDARVLEQAARAIRALKETTDPAVPGTEGE